VRDADAVLFVVDGSEAVDKETHEALQALDPSRSIVIMNKSDQFDNEGGHRAGVVEIVESDIECVTLSALRGEGVPELVRTLIEKVGGEGLAAVARERVVLNARLVSLMTAAADKSALLRESLSEKRPLEMMAVEARETLAAYEEATGRSYQSDVLDVIFSRFCIGK
jgi:tRNA modification GTPase